MIFGKHINKYYLKYLPVLILGMAALILVDFVQLKIPEIYRIVINGMNSKLVPETAPNFGMVEIGGRLVPFGMDVLWHNICLPMIVIILILIVGRFFWRICFYGSSVKVETDLRNKMFDHCKELSREYFQVNKVGGLMSLFTNDLETINECFGDGLLMLCDAVFQGTLAFIKMYRMDPSLTALALIPMLILLIIGLIVGKVMMKKWEIRQQAFSNLSDFAQESFSGYAVIKAFVKELKELLAFRKLNTENEDANVTYTKIATLMSIMIGLLVESIICVILGYGGSLVHEGKFNAGQLMEYIGYFTAILWPIMAVAMLIEKTSRGRASLNRISALLNAKIDVKDREGVTELTDVKGKIEFRKLNFRYPDGEFDVLSDVSFTIEAGENVGIVGKTGSGKTTLVDLILRTYNVPDGTVFIDGHDINSVSIHSVRENCSYVPQDNFLFSDTITKNIGFAFDSVTEGQIETAARLSDVHDNIAGFKEGYSTVLGERGVTVSGGQKQRISIARALVKNAPILILDDSVSAVDTDTEKVILENLRNSRKGKTTILIAHRISTIEGMDKIIFIDEGRIEAIGAHEELYKNCSEYHKMVELQKLEDEKGDEMNA